MDTKRRSHYTNPVQFTPSKLDPLKHILGRVAFPGNIKLEIEFLATLSFSNPLIYLPWKTDVLEV